MTLLLYALTAPPPPLPSRRQAGRDSFGTEQLLKTYLDRYSRVMDERDESKGMNNFNSSVQALLAGKGKG